MTKHTRTAPPVQSPEYRLPSQRAKAQRQANATLDAAAPLRYVPSMGKRLAASEWSDSMKKSAHAALIAWNKP